MHTVLVIAAGLVLLVLCLFIGRALHGSTGLALGALAFLPLWLVGAALNLYRGVRIAGYSLADETPIVLVVFALPALVALILWWRWR